MSAFPSLPDPPHLADVFRRFPTGARPLLELHDVWLRGESPLSVAERELIAAYVSALNACAFCAGSHRAIAELHGVDPDLLERLVEQPDAAEAPAELAPLLAYVRELTRTPSKLAPADAEAVYAAGWDEEALYHAVGVASLFNLMNRIVEGCGVVGNESTREASRARHAAAAEDPEAAAHPYVAFGRRIGVI